MPQKVTEDVSRCWLANFLYLPRNNRYFTSDSSFLLQRDTTQFTNENTELKLRLQAMAQQAQLRDGMIYLVHCLPEFYVSRSF